MILHLFRFTYRRFRCRICRKRQSYGTNTVEPMGTARALPTHPDPAPGKDTLRQSSQHKRHRQPVGVKSCLS